MNKRGHMSYEDIYLIIKYLNLSKSVTTDERKKVKQYFENSIPYPQDVWDFLTSHEPYAMLIEKRRIKTIEELTYYADEYNGRKEKINTRNWSDTYCPKRFRR